MHNDKMGEAEHQSRPYQRFDRIIGETGKILFEIVGIATEMPHERGIDILQAPTRDHSIIARDEKTREHTEITHILPCIATRDSAVCPRSVGLRMATNNKLIDYALKVKKNNEAEKAKKLAEEAEKKEKNRLANQRRAEKNRKKREAEETKLEKTFMTAMAGLIKELKENDGH